MYTWLYFVNDKVYCYSLLFTLCFFLALAPIFSPSPLEPIFCSLPLELYFVSDFLRKNNIGAINNSATIKNGIPPSL